MLWIGPVRLYHIENYTAKNIQAMHIMNVHLPCDVAPFALEEGSRNYNRRLTGWDML